MLTNVLQAGQQRLSGAVTIDDGRERVLQFKNGILYAYLVDGKALDALDAVLPEARKPAFAEVVDGYVARLEDRPLVLHPNAKLPRCLLHGDERRVAEALSEGPSTPQALVDRGLDRRAVHAVFFAAALTGRLCPPEVAPVSMPPRHSRPVEKKPSFIMGEVRVSQKPVRRSSASMPAVSHRAPRRPSASMPAVSHRAPRRSSTSIPAVRPSRPSMPVARPSRPSMPVARPSRPSMPVARPSRPSMPSAAGSGTYRLVASAPPQARRSLFPESPAEAFAQASLALQRLELDRAIKLAMLATKGDRDNADYAALLAFANAEKKAQTLGNSSQGKREDAYAEEMATLDELCRPGVDSALAFYYRARLLKRLGRSAAAQEDFQRVVALDPRNIDAQREVKAWAKRRSSGSMPAVKPRRRLFG